MLCLEHSHDIPRADGILREGKGAVLLHFPPGAKKGAQGGASESAADADAPDSNCRESGQAQLGALQSHEDVHRAIDRADHRGDVVLAGDAWRLENIGARFLIGLQTLDRVSEVSPADQVVFGSCR